LIACEFSGVVREAFRKRGHDAWSCDLLPAADGSPFHIQDDVLAHLGDGWDEMIAHPPCRYLTRAGLRWITSPPKKLKPGILYGEARRLAMEDAIGFVLALWDAPIERVAIENPCGVLGWRWRKPDQVVQPWWFGDGEVKGLALWKRNLPDLTPTNIVAGREPKVHLESPGIKNGLTREQRRSITRPGFAAALAAQWG